jgi:hypothetical protein
MGPMAATESAIFAEFEPLRGLLLVFLRVIVPALTFRTRHHDHHARLFLGHPLLPLRRSRRGIPSHHNMNKTDRRSVRPPMLAYRCASRNGWVEHRWFRQEGNSTVAVSCSRLAPKSWIDRNGKPIACRRRPDRRHGVQHVAGGPVVGSGGAVGFCNRGARPCRHWALVYCF